MTVSTTVNRAQYDGNGATTVFPYPFRILEDSHLVVTVIDSAENETTLTQDTDYTISGVGRYNGGYITLTGGALAAGKTISLDRVVPDTQEASIRNQGAYLPEIHEDALDKLTMIIQGVVSTLTGRALLKPSWLAKYYDAKGNRIANMANPVNAQDATTKSYVDGQVASSTAGWQAGDAALNKKIDSNFQRTLRVPESSVYVLPRLAVRSGMLLGFNDLGNPVAIAGQTATADLALKLAESTGAALSGYRYSTVYDVLSRIKTLSDIGATTSFGRNPAADALIIADAPRDNALLLPGRLVIAAEGKGVARYGVGLSVRVGAGDYGLYPQVAGVASTQALANYGRPDLVGYYVDVTGAPYKDWEKIESPTYTATGLTADGLATDKLEPDMVMRTLHDTPWTGVIESISGNTITLKDGWWQAGASAASTPTAGYGLRVNPYGKGWVGNKNLLLLPGSRLVNGMLEEWGISNRVGFSTEIGGLDLVTLGTSTYDSNFGLRVRMANDATNRFRYGFVAQACVNGFTSTPLTLNGTEYAPTYGFQANGNHTAAFIAANIGNSNVAFQNTDVNGVVRYRVGGDGYAKRMHRAKLWISSDTGAITDNYPVICTATGISQNFTIAALSYVGAEFSIFKYYPTGTLTLSLGDSNARFFFNGAYSTTLAFSASCRVDLVLGGTTSSPIWYATRTDISAS